MSAEVLVEQLGILGVLIAGATPWLEAVVVIPIAIALGLPPVWSALAAVAGNALTIVLFALGSEKVLARIEARRVRRGRGGEPNARIERAKKIFARYGDVGMAVLGPWVIGTQFAAALAVSLGVSVVRASVVQVLGAAVWGVATGATAWAIVG